MLVCNRREALLTLLGWALATPAALRLTAAPGLTVPVSAAASAKPRRTLAKCPAASNCISSTSVGNPSKYGAPWSFAEVTDDPQAAWRSLQEALQQQPHVQIVESDDVYVHAVLPSRFPSRGTDDLEFLMRPEERLVLYRSASRDTQYIYPFAQPLSDFGHHQRRLEEIRGRLGWRPLDWNQVY